MASRLASYPSTFTRVDVPTVILPAADPSSPPDNPRTAAFVRSQVEHLPFYKQEGVALFAGWLDEQAKLEEETPGRSKARGPSVPSRSSEGGIRAVDVLAGVRTEEKSSSSASAAKEGSSGPSRVRMADRMKGKDGAQRPTKRSATGAHQSTATRQQDLKPAAKEVKQPQRVDDGPTASQQTEVVLTRKESRHRGATNTCATPHSPPTSPRHRKRTSNTSEPPIDPLETHDKDHKKRRRLDTLYERPKPAPPDDNQPSPPPKPKHSSKHSTKPIKVDPPTPAKPSSSSKPAKMKTKSKAPAPSKSAPVSGKENHDEAEEIAVRLEERKLRRRAKAAILNPKPRPPPSSSSAASSSSDGSEEREGDSSASSQNSRRKTRRVKRKRRSDKNEERPKKKKKDERKKKKENRDLGTSLGMGLGIMDKFRADNVGSGPSYRLTLKRDFPKPGVFNKGRASSKVEAKGRRSDEPVGVPDLVFSEARFLSRPRPAPRSPSPSTASGDPPAPPPRRRTANPRTHKLPSPPPNMKSKKKKVKQPKRPPVEESDEEQDRESSESNNDADRPVETVSKFFAAAKSDKKTANDEDKFKKAPILPPAAPKRVDYSPSWPDTEEIAAAPSKATATEAGRKEQRPETSTSSRRSGSRHQPAISTASSHPKSERSFPSDARPPAPNRPPSAQHRPASSHYSEPKQKPSSGIRSGVFPLPIPRRQPPAPTRANGPSPPRRPSRRRQRLIYDGNSSVGDFAVISRQPVNHLGPSEPSWNAHGDSARPGSGPRPDLSDLGEEADVFRAPRYDRADLQDQRHESYPNEEVAGEHDPYDAYQDGPHGQDALFDQDAERYDESAWYGDEDQPKHDSRLDYTDPNDDPHAPPHPHFPHNRSAFQHRSFASLDQDTPDLDEQQDYAPSTYYSDEGDVNEPADVEDDVDLISMDANEMDWTGYWKPHRT